MSRSQDLLSEVGPRVPRKLLEAEEILIQNKMFVLLELSFAQHLLKFND